MPLDTFFDAPSKREERFLTPQTPFGMTQDYALPKWGRAMLDTYTERAVATA